MTTRVIEQVFDQYQKARVQFVQTVADLALKPQNVELLDNAGVLHQLCILLWDIVPSVQQLAAISLGRLAGHDIKVAQSIIKKDIMPQLLQKIDKQNKLYKKSALFLLRSIAKHSPEMASMVVHRGGLDATILCLEDFDTGVKEAAAWAIGYISRHNKCLAQSAVDAGAVPLLVLCLQEPDLCLKQICASALCDISKHSEELAHITVEAGAIPFLAKALSSSTDPKLKRQVLSAFGSIAKHSVELAEMVFEGQIFPDALMHMAHPDENVAKAAAVLAREMCKHTCELAQLIVKADGIPLFIKLIGSNNKSAKLPAIMALGYIAGHSELFALNIIEEKGIQQLALVLETETEDHILAITAWTLGQIGKHSSDHAQAIAEEGVFSQIVELYNEPRSSEDLRTKCKSMLKQVLQKCTFIEALEPLLHKAPSHILKYVLGQFSKILPNNSKARRLFVTTGGLKKVQEIHAEPGSLLLEYITIINCCFPEEIVRYYTPGYPDTLLEAVDQYQPNCPTLFGEGEMLHDYSQSSSSILGEDKKD